jgi:hypothetical protein
MFYNTGSRPKCIFAAVIFKGSSLEGRLHNISFYFLRSLRLDTIS